MARRSTSRSTKRVDQRSTSSEDVVVGVVRGPHGVRGEVRVEPLTDVPAKRFRAGVKVLCGGVGELTIASVRGTERDPIVHFAGYEDRGSAEALRGKELAIPRAEARRAAGSGYLWGDLIGLRVSTPEGRDLGVVTEVIRAGETDVLVARGEAGETMLPAIESVIREIDVGGGRIVAVPQEELS